MSTEPVARPHPEPVVLDIGGGIGALVVHWDSSELDTPIEISPTGRDGDRQHQHVLKRPMHDRVFHAAAFDAVPAGQYTLWVHGEAKARDVTIISGQVTEVHWERRAVPAVSRSSDVG